MDSDLRSPADPQASPVASGFRWRWVLAAVAVLLLLWLGWKTWRVGSIGYDLGQTLLEVRAMAQNPGQADLLALPPMLSDTRQNLEDLQAELGPFYGLIERAGWLPVVGGDVQAGPALLDMGVSLTQAGDLAVQAVSPLSATLTQEDDFSIEALVPVLIDTLAENRAQFEQAGRHVEEAIAARSRVDTEALSPQVQEVVALLDEVLPLLDAGFAFAPHAPALLGADGPKTYLIVAQNDDELRATGGFITAVGTLKLEQGRVITLTFEDSYAVDDFTQEYPSAPPQLLRYMMAHIWLFRDGNWSPDFPTSAQAMAELYSIGREGQVDGIVAVDQITLREIVRVLQPVQVAGWDEPVTGRNVIRLIRDSWSPDDENFDGWDRDWWEDRKNFTGDMVSALQERVREAPGEVDWVYMARTIIQLLAERHLQGWLAEPELQAVLSENNWSGELRSSPGDYLFAVDTNVGFNKANPKLKRVLRYQLDLSNPQAETLTSTVTLTHTSQSEGQEACLHKPRYGKVYEDMIDRCYWAYVRLYRPAESTLLKANPRPLSGTLLLSGEAEPARVETLDPERGYPNWGTLVMVSHQEQRTTQFEFAVPGSVVQETDAGWLYQLLIQKQAGTQNNTVRVEIQLPAGTEVLHSQPEPDEITENNLLVYNFALSTDQPLTLEFASN